MRSLIALSSANVTLPQHLYIIREAQDEAGGRSDQDLQRFATLE